MARIEVLEPRLALSGSANVDVEFGFVHGARPETTNGWAAVAKLTVDDGGNTYLIGCFSGTLTFDSGPAPTYSPISLVSGGAADAFVVKYSASGALLWAKGLGGSGPDFAAGISVAKNGDIYVTGAFEGSNVSLNGGELLQSGGQCDVFICKLDSLGNTVWTRRMGGGGVDAGCAIEVADDGSIYLSGVFQGTVDFDPGLETRPLTAVGEMDTFVCKLDSSGNYAWAHSWGRRGDGVVGGASLTLPRRSEANGLSSIAVNAHGDIVVLYSAISISQSSSGASTEGHAVRLDAAGNEIWNRSFGRGTSTVDVAFAPDDSVIISGKIASNPSSQFDLVTTIGDAIFICGLGAGGDQLWEKRLSAMGMQSGIALGSDGSVYTTGGCTYLGSSPAADQPPVGSIDVLYLTRLDSAGNLVWTREVDGAQVPAAIAVAADGRVFVAGSFQGIVNFDPARGPNGLLGSAGSSGIFVLMWRQIATDPPVRTPLPELRPSEEPPAGLPVAEPSVVVVPEDTGAAAPVEIDAAALAAVLAIGDSRGSGGQVQSGGSPQSPQNGPEGGGSGGAPAGGLPQMGSSPLIEQKMLSVLRDLILPPVFVLDVGDQPPEPKRPEEEIREARQLPPAPPSSKGIASDQEKSPETAPLPAAPSRWPWIATAAGGAASLALGLWMSTRRRRQRQVLDELIFGAERLADDLGPMERVTVRWQEEYCDACRK